MFQYTVTAALLATFLAKKTKFLFPNKSINQLIESEVDEEIGKAISSPLSVLAF